MGYYLTQQEKDFFSNEFSIDIWKDNYRDSMEMVEGYVDRQTYTIFANETDILKAALKDALFDKRICFGGRVGANIGTSIKNVHAFNCYAAQRSTKPYDSIKNIYMDLWNGAEILKTEGGIGFNFNHLRPKGTLIKGIGSYTPGVVEFMRLYDVSADIITKGNSGEKFQVMEDSKTKKKTRKGAQMSMLDCRHPEIFDYIEAKRVPNVLTKFNMSVAIIDTFMQAVEANGDWELWFPDIHDPRYDDEWNGDFDEWEEKGYARIIYKTIKARELWDCIIKNTYNRNEPGVYFIDNANRFNNLKYYQKITGTNPCGEISMLADAGVVEINGVLYEHIGDICNLGTLNLVKYFNGLEFDFELFTKDIAVLVRALDNLIDISSYPLEGLKNAAKLRRKIGCGLMGYGSLLFMMRMKYGSSAAKKFTHKLMKIYANTAYQASAQLAEEKGSFLLYDSEKILRNGFIKNSGVLDYNTLKAVGSGLRNSQLLTIAPNGNTSIIMDIVSGGMEPVYEKTYIRWVGISHRVVEEMGDKPYPDFFKGEWYETDYFKFSKKGDEEVLKSTDGAYMIDKNRGITKRVVCEDYGWTWIKSHLSQSEIDYYEVDNTFATATELSIEEHVEPFIILSKYIDNSISKTANIANDYPIDEFSNLFIRMWKEGVRGFTTYREGTMTAVLESMNEDEKSRKQIKKDQKEFYGVWEGHDGDKVFEDVELPEEYPAMGYVIKTEGKKYYLNCAFKDKKMTRPFALFVHTNNRESEILTYSTIEILEALAKNEGIPQQHIDKNKAKCAGQNNINKLARTISLLLRHNVSIEIIVKALDAVEEVPLASFVFRVKKFLASFLDEIETGEVCPECGASLVYREGCKNCSECSYNKCGG